MLTFAVTIVTFSEVEFTVIFSTASWAPSNHIRGIRRKPRTCSVAARLSRTKVRKNVPNESLRHL